MCGKSWGVGSIDDVLRHGPSGESVMCLFRHIPRTRPGAASTVTVRLHADQELR